MSVTFGTVPVSYLRNQGVIPMKTYPAGFLVVTFLVSLGCGALVNRCVKKFRQQQPSTTPLPCLHLQIERPGEPLASAPVR